MSNVMAKSHRRRYDDISEAEFEQALIQDVAEFYDDPFGYVMYAFPWGKGELSDADGPDDWQREQLIRVGEAFQKDPETTIREAVASGHGIGKTALVAWIILWAMSTRPHLNGVVTANTSNQLATKTWRELSLWHKRALNAHWFKWTATRFTHKDHPETWFVAAVPNTEQNSEAFAGTHAKHVLMIYDEASAIPDVIWEVSEGAMTTPRAMWFCYGNPTRNTGRFRTCFQADRHRWHTEQIDSRTCKMTNKAELQEWVDTYGEDSDFVRVRVKGQFPRAGTMQFIPSDLVDLAMRADAEYESYFLMPTIFGGDVARYGDDKSVAVLRQGRKIVRMWKFRELNTMQLSTEYAAILREYKPDAAFVDELGIGAGVVDRLRMLGHEIIGVNVGKEAEKKELYYNKRSEIWARMRAWLVDGADLPNDSELKDALIGVEYGFDKKERTQLERKKDMKARGLPSPDEGDAIALTFTDPVVAKRYQSFEPDDSFEPEPRVEHIT